VQPDVWESSVPQHLAEPLVDSPRVKRLAIWLAKYQARLVVGWPQEQLLFGLVRLVLFQRQEALLREGMLRRDCGVFGSEKTSSDPPASWFRTLTRVCLTCKILACRSTSRHLSVLWVAKVPFSLCNSTVWTVFSSSTSFCCSAFTARTAAVCSALSRSRSTARASFACLAVSAFSRSIMVFSSSLPRMRGEQERNQ
jgi:hypothetical protein